MTDERNLKTGRAIVEVGADWAILTSPDTVCYATGHDVPIEAGPSPFAGGPSCAIVGTDGTAALVVANPEETAARGSRAARVTAYEGFGDRRQAPVVDNFLAALATTLTDLDMGGAIAVERTSFPDTVRGALGERAAKYLDIDAALWRQRAAKTAAEIDALRACAGLTAIGQDAGLAAARPGRSELELFADVRCAMERAAGARLPVTGDLLTGVDRTARFTGWPVERVVGADDPIIFDLAPRHRGYWGDSCNTVHLGTPSGAFDRMYTTVTRAFAHAADVLRPGLRAGAFDAEVRGVVRADGYDYPHHTGHGIGTSVHEYPRLVPEETAVLEAGMVVMVEPGAYVPGVGGVRLEKMFLLTADGNECLSPFEHRLRP